MLNATKLDTVPSHATEMGTAIVGKSVLEANAERRVRHLAHRVRYAPTAPVCPAVVQIRIVLMRSSAVINNVKTRALLD